MFDGFFYLINNILLFTSGIDNGSCFPTPLNAEDERKAIEDWQRTNDKKYRDKLVHHNMRLVVHIAKKYGNYPDSDELISVGAIGLIKAVNSYTLDKGTSLATYSARCIENEILMVMRSNKKHVGNISLNDPVGLDKEGNEMTFMDLIATEDADLVDVAEFEIIREYLMSNLEKTLTERELDIIKMRYGILGSEAYTQKDVAKKFNISRSYVSRIESKCIDKMKTLLEKYSD